MAIRFKFSPAKALAAIHWMVSERHDIDLHAALKACYFADKSHLNEFQRPVFGATYKAMRYGPVPVEIYEMMKGEPIWLPETSVDAYPWRLDGFRLVSTDNSKADLGALSETDIEHFGSALARSLGMTFNERTAATHGADWEAAGLGYMRYEDMLDDGPNKPEVVDYLKANSQYMRL